MKSSRILILALCLSVIAAWALSSCAGAPPRANPPLRSSVHVDLHRYTGTWYVIGHVPYFAERGKVATRDVYTLDAQGNVDTTYVYRNSFDGPTRTMHSLGVVQPNTDNHYWIVHFWWVFRADYLVLDVAPDYSWALVGQPSRKLAWIMARKPQVDDALYRSLLNRFAAHGYDPSVFRRVPQLKSQRRPPDFE